MSKKETKSRIYHVKTDFIFSGEFQVKAKSRRGAKEIVKEHCSMVGNIHSHLPYPDVDWEFPSYPEKKVR